MEKFEEEDEDKDGLVSWKEYLNKVFGYTLEDVEDMRQTVGTAKNKNDEVHDIENSLKVSYVQLIND